MTLALPKDFTASPQVPLYLKIREVLRSRILDGTYLTHVRLPSESEVMAEFGVSRITVRQALRDLHNENLIFSVQGKGSFVAKPKAVQDLVRLEGFSEAMAPKGYKTFSRLLSVKEIRAPKQVTAMLALERGASVIEIRRVRHLNQQPLSLDVSYFSMDIGMRLIREDLGTRDIFGILENDFGLELESADCQIDAILADQSLATDLSTEVGSPILRVERLTFAKGRKPIDFEFLHIRGDAYKYRIWIERNHRHGGQA